MRRTTVLGASALPLVEEGLCAAIKGRPELELLGVARDGRAALDAIKERRPQVAVVDDELGGLSALRIVAAVRRDRLATRVVVMGGDPEPDTVYRALGDGAAGYVTKRASVAQLCDSIVAAARGETVIAGELHAGLAGAIRARSAREGPVLSERESEVIALMGEGLNTNAIAARLYLSPATVKTHQHHIYEKLGVSERAAAVAAALRRGLIE